MSKMCPPLEKIQGLTAEEILVKFGQENNIPVDIKKILSDIGALVVEDDLEFMDETEYVKKQVEKYGELCGAVFATKEILAVFYKKLKFDLTSEEAKKSAENRNRFTLAHELAHCVLHAKHLETGYLEFRHDNPNIENEPLDKSSYEFYEYQANIYAGQLLIPEKKLYEAIEKLILPTVKSLCELFQVSTNVMKARLRYLNINNVEDI